MLSRPSLSLLAWVLAVCAPVTFAGESPTTAPSNPLFPLKRGTTWKYLVTAETDDKADKPYVQTLTAGGPLIVKGQLLVPIDGDLFQAKPDGIYLFGRKEGDTVTPLGEPQKWISARPHTSDAWSGVTKTESTYTTCMGNQNIKTEAGDFATQCVYSSTTSNTDGSVTRQVYRYFARDVGLVRETVSEKARRPDGSIVKRDLTRDLISFAAAEEIKPPDVAKALEPIGSDSLRGDLVDPTGQPIAQATLAVLRIDKSESLSLQTDAYGRFAAAGLDPAGSYRLTARLTGYESADVPLKSSDRKPVRLEVRLAAAGPATSGSPDANSFEGLFAAGRTLAADGDHRGALAKYDAALALSKDDANVIAHKAISHISLGQTKEAQQEIEQSLRANDKEYTFWQIAGQVKAAQNQLAQARALFDKAAQLSPKHAGAVYTDLAAVLAAKNDDKLAGDIESALKSAATAAPPSAEALFQLGQSYANVGKLEGRAYLQKFLDVAAKLPEADQDKQKIQVAKQLIRALDVLKQAKP